jgi:hypothetical protein
MNEKQIDKYLLDEMPEKERAQFEDQYTVDDELFYQIAERENELVDRYVRGELAVDDRERFEQTLNAFPSRRQKIENAKILHEFIADERPTNKTITIAERSGVFSRLFSFGPSVQFASMAIIVILGLASLFLWSENRRLGSLEQELAASRQREADLSAKFEEESETSGDLAADLESEREKIASLEAELVKRGNSNKDRPVSSNPPSIVATLFLSGVGFRGDAVPTKSLKLAPGVTRVSVVVGVPSDATVGETLSITLNGERVVENAKAAERRGEKSVSVTVPAARLKAGRNELSVIDNKSAVVARYIIAVTQAP